MNPRWLLRAKRLAQNPPSWGKVKFVLIIVTLCLILVLIERLFGWPEALTPNNVRGLRSRP